MSSCRALPFLGELLANLTPGPFKRADAHQHKELQVGQVRKWHARSNRVMPDYIGSPNTCKNYKQRAGTLVATRRASGCGRQAASLPLLLAPLAGFDPRAARAAGPGGDRPGNDDAAAVLLPDPRDFAVPAVGGGFLKSCDGDCETGVTASRAGDLFRSRMLRRAVAGVADKVVERDHVR
jgi:hypothetical protein